MYLLFNKNSMKKLVYFLPSLMLLFTATLAHAGANLNYIDNVFTQIDDLITDILIPLLFGLALLVFIWGVIQYFILGADDEGKRETGRAYMLYAILGLVAIVAVWGIVGIVVTIFGVGGGTTPSIPGVPGGTTP